MKYLKLAVVFVALAMMSCNNSSVATKELKTEIDSVSYALGLSMAKQTKQNFSEINRAVYEQGFRNGLDSVGLLLEDKDVMLVINNFFRKKQAEEQRKKFAKVKKEGEDFLATNKTKEGVKTTTSGLQYEVLKEGTGEKPKATDRVRVHYHGTLVDGTVFDSSVDRGTPAEFNVNGVIKGWIEGLQLMPVGSKYRFFVPQELAYGANPRPGGKIRPFDALVFEVEVLDIVK